MDTPAGNRRGRRRHGCHAAGVLDQQRVEQAQVTILLSQQEMEALQAAFSDGQLTAATGQIVTLDPEQGISFLLDAITKIWILLFLCLPITSKYWM